MARDCPLPIDEVPRVRRPLGEGEGSEPPAGADTGLKASDLPPFPQGTGRAPQS